MHTSIASESHFDSLRGTCGLLITSEVKADHRIELSDLNYPDINMHVASGGQFGGPWGHGGLQMTSEDISDFKLNSVI